eukprot:COSAG02_NODE_33422_length_500_cov_0.890274_2_plen_24_part_01
MRTEFVYTSSAVARLVRGEDASPS